MKEWLYDFYKENEDFKRYVDKACKNQNKGIFEVLEELMTEYVALSYQGRLK